jgi:cytochrome c oxidase assembly factor CtaG
VLAFAGAVFPGPLATRLFSAHAALLLLVTEVVAPLLVLGLPAWLVEGLLPAPGAAPAARATLRRLSAPPLAGLAFTAALVVGHLPAVFAAAGRGLLAHAAITTAVLALSVLGWWCVCGPSEALGRRREPAAMIYLFALGVPLSGVGAAITLAKRPRYVIDEAAAAAHGLTPLADQQLGGLLLWVVGGLLLWVGITALWVRWSRRHEAGAGAGGGPDGGDDGRIGDRADDAPPLTLPRRD